MPDGKCPRCGAEPVEHKGWYCPDAEDSEWPSRVALKGRWACGSSLPYIGDFRQSDACAITALQQQLAEAKARVAHLEWCCAKMNSDICQTLGKALGYPRFGDLPQVCDDPTESSICVFEHVAETLADEIASQLADARQALTDAHCFLDHWIDLATEHHCEKLSTFQLVVRMNDAVCNAFGHNYDPETEGTFSDEMRTRLESRKADELRAALQKAIGEA